MLLCSDDRENRVERCKEYTAGLYERYSPAARMLQPGCTNATARLYKSWKSGAVIMNKDSREKGKMHSAHVCSPNSCSLIQVIHLVLFFYI